MNSWCALATEEEILKGSQQRLGRVTVTVSYSRIFFTAKPGDCGPWGGAGEELLCATLDGTAGRMPNRGCGPRAAAEAATRHNVTKPLIELG